MDINGYFSFSYFFTIYLKFTSQNMIFLSEICQLYLFSVHLYKNIPQSKANYDQFPIIWREIIYDESLIIAICEKLWD